MEVEEGSQINYSLPSTDKQYTKSDLIEKELNFDIDPNDPLTKASLNDHPVDEWMDILGNGQLRKKVLKEGKENSRPNRSDICFLKLIGRLEDGTVIDDRELSIQLGDAEVIQGIDLAVTLMNTEEEAEVEIDSRFGYGPLGRNSPPLPKIPPNAKLIYNIILNCVEMEPEVDNLQYSEKRGIGNKKKEQGNWWFSRSEYTLAIQCYRKALFYLSPTNENDVGDDKNLSKLEPVTDTELQALLEDALVVQNNLAAAQLKCEAYDAALQSVESVLRCQPQNIKALYRKGKILHWKGDHAKAYAVLTQALKVKPDDKAIQQELAILKKKSAKDAHHEKKLYRKMLGTLPDNKQNHVTQGSSEKRGTKVKWSLLGGTIVAVVGIIAYRFVS